jgi:hypothetical protein
MRAHASVVAPLVALLMLAALPGRAAANPYGPCPAPPQTPLEKQDGIGEVTHQAWEEACAQEAKEAAETKAKAEVEQAPATLLEVNVRQDHGSAYSQPGHTDLLIKATVFSHVTVSTQPATPTLRYQSGVPTEEEELLGVEEAGPAHGIQGAKIKWSCRHPRETIHYTVTAQGASGPPLIRTGAFTIPLSARWCAAAKREERHELEVIDHEEARHRAEERKEAAEHARREAEAQHRELEQWEANCRKLGGTVVWLHVGNAGATAPYCRAPNGGTINVPL